MLCCKRKERKETAENVKFKEISTEDDKMPRTSGIRIGPLDVKEWKIILRENIIVMDEYNLIRIRIEPKSFKIARSCQDRPK